MCNIWDAGTVKKWILYLLLIFEVVEIFAEDTQGLITKAENSRTLLGNHKTKERRKKLAVQKAREWAKGMRLFNGEYYTDPSMALVMSLDSDEWLTWYYDNGYVPSSSGLLVSDQCIATWASEYVDTSVVPVVSNITDPEALIAYFPRQGCDRAYHLERMYLPSPSYDDDTYAHDLALWRLKKKVAVGDPICGEMPIYPAPVSCDRDGPPAGYKDCYASGWGPTNDSQDMAPSNIRPNRIKVITLSYEQCEASRVESDELPEYSLDPNTEVCVISLAGTDPVCDYDYNDPLICKYWKPVNDSNQGWGWSQNSQGNGWNSNSQGVGWNSQKTQRWVVVGHRNYHYGYNCQNTQDAAVRMLRFGAKAYTSVFGDCGLVCSNELPHGYECKEKWDSALGPVYCTPQKIHRPPHNSNGWRK